MKFTFRDIVWVGIIALTLLVLSKCHRDDNDNLGIDIKQLKEKAYKDSIALTKQVQIHEYTAEVARQQAIIYTAKNKIIERQLDSTNLVAMRLARYIKGYEQPGIDTTFTTVGPEYINYCDSLADLTVLTSYNFGNYKKNTAIVLAAKDTMLMAKDSIISIERLAKQKTLRDYNGLMHFCQDMQKEVKPRGQVYIGAELMANPSHFINNAGVALSLKTKSNKLWQVSGGIQSNGGYYARVNGNILIKLK